MAFSALPILAVLLWSFYVSPARAHSRWKCPTARNSDTGIKTGPCGSETNNFATDGDNSASIITLQPGPLRVFFEESIYHTGAPFRIALSGDGSDESNVCVLLDHIPHNDDLSSSPLIFDESTYTPYSITINIPDVQCDRCSLHLTNPMTDKIGEDGAVDGVGCTDPNGSCFSVYHSCTVPFQILGSIPRADYSCPGQPTDWPTAWTGDGGVSVDATVPGLYRREGSIWSSDGFLQNAPEQYRLDAGGVCGPLGELIYESSAEQLVKNSTMEPEVVGTATPIPSSATTSTSTSAPSSSPVSSSSSNMTEQPAIAAETQLPTQSSSTVEPATETPTRTPTARVPGTSGPSPKPTSGNPSPAQSAQGESNNNNSSSGTSNGSPLILLTAHNAWILTVSSLATTIAMLLF